MHFKWGYKVFLSINEECGRGRERGRRKKVGGRGGERNVVGRRKKNVGEEGEKNEGGGEIRMGEEEGEVCGWRGKKERRMCEEWERSILLCQKK